MIPDHLNENIPISKPPLGCRPKWAVNEERMHELIGAIHRRGEWCENGAGKLPGYISRGDLILIMGWAEELVDLLSENLRGLEAKDDSNL